MSKVPVVSGGDGQMYMDSVTAKVLAEADKLAEKAGDSYVTAERLLTALALTKSGAADALKKAGVTPQALNSAINDLRQGRTADSANAEGNFEASLKKLRSRSDRGCPRRPAGPGDWPRRRNPPRYPGAEPPDQEQPCSSSVSPASVKPPSPRGWRCASSMAMCLKACSTNA